VRFDVLVPGGGAAGCVLAGRRSEDSSRTVCLVEAGPDYGHLSEGRCRRLLERAGGPLVVDASAIPVIPCANTNLTTVAPAERAAEWL
jgi:choline dehydrogenase-like flavoprotein